MFNIRNCADDDAGRKVPSSLADDSLQPSTAGPGEEVRRAEVDETMPQPEGSINHLNNAEARVHPGECSDPG